MYNIKVDKNAGLLLHDRKYKQKGLYKLAYKYIFQIYNNGVIFMVNKLKEIE